MSRFQLQRLVLSVFGIAVAIKNTSAQQNNLGHLFKCAHNLSGEVFVKNEREIIIKGFHYDGIGPGTWFHAMKKGIEGGVHTSDPAFYYTLPFPNGNCEALTNGSLYTGVDVKLTLPVSIMELETIGMLNYQDCHNIGHVIIPKVFEAPAAASNVMKTEVCPKPDYKPCFSKGGGDQETSHGGPNCSPVGPGPSAPSLGNIYTSNASRVLMLLLLAGAF